MVVEAAGRGQDAAAVFVAPSGPSYDGPLPTNSAILDLRTASWGVRPEAGSIERGDVHVWRASVDQLGDRVADLTKMLSPSERAIAELFSQQSDSVRFTIRRAMPREILGRELHTDPAELRFWWGSRGQPRVLGTDIHFNVAALKHVVVCGASRGAVIGCGLADFVSHWYDDELVDYFFSPSERARLSQLPDSDRISAFCRWWAAKEALFAAAVEDWRTSVAQLEGDSSDAYALVELAPADGYTAVLAVRGGFRNVRLHDWGRDGGADGERAG